MAIELLLSAIILIRIRIYGELADSADLLVELRPCGLGLARPLPLSEAPQAALTEALTARSALSLCAARALARRDRSAKGMGEVGPAERGGGCCFWLPGCCEAGMIKQRSAAER